MSNETCRYCKHLGWIEHFKTHTCNRTQETYHTVERIKGMAGYTSGQTTFLENTCDKFDVKEQTQQTPPTL
jgi:hypothetical protein